MSADAFKVVYEFEVASLRIRLHPKKQHMIPALDKALEEMKLI